MRSVSGKVRVCVSLTVNSSFLFDCLQRMNRRRDQRPPRRYVMTHDHVSDYMHTNNTIFNLLIWLKTKGSATK